MAAADFRFNATESHRSANAPWNDGEIGSIMFDKVVYTLNARFGNARNAILLAIAVFLLLAILVLHSLFSASRSVPTGQQYDYSTDNGRTFFSSSTIHIPPFRHNGKKTFQVGVFVNSKGQPFVAYVFKYTPTGQGILQGLPKIDGQTVDNSQMRQDAAKHCLVRRPGGKTWVRWNSPAGQKIVNGPHLANGKPALPYGGN